MIGWLNIEYPNRHVVCKIKSFVCRFGWDRFGQRR